METMAARADRSEVVVRGAVHLGAGGDFPDDIPTIEQLTEKYVFRPLAEQIAVQWMPFKAGREFFDISKHHDWSPSREALSPGLIGFSAAIQDVTTALMRPEVFDERFGPAAKEQEVGHDILTFIRASREDVMLRRVPVG